MSMQINRKWKKLKEFKKPRTNTGPGLTKQEFRKNADVNEIVKRGQALGYLDNVNPNVQPVFADVSTIGTFRDLVVRMNNAKAAFMSLPAHVRSRFGNDPANLVEFLQDDSNADEAEKLGLVRPLEKEVKDEAAKVSKKTSKGSKSIKEPKEPNKEVSD